MGLLNSDVFCVEKDARLIIVGHFDVVFLRSNLRFGADLV